MGGQKDDQEFCRYPITNHFAVNPYRYRPETTRGSQHLLHAIVALSCHFRLRSATQSQPPADAVDHKNTAVVLYQGALSKKDIHVHGLSLLDTAMALWQFEVCIPLPAQDLPSGCSCEKKRNGEQRTVNANVVCVC